MVPFLTLILTARDYPPQHVLKMAVATSLATICFTSLSSVLAHHRRGAVLWPIVRYLAPGIIVGSLLGSQFAAAMSAQMLGYVFAGFVVIAAQNMPPGALGYLYWPAFLVLSVASMLTAPLGARVAHKLEVAPLKRVFAGVLYALAFYFILR